MNTPAFHISLYDLAFLGTIFIGLNFALLLGFAGRINRAANRFLALALLTVVLWMARALGIDIQLTTYFPHWSWLPLQFSLAIGPLIYFYVLKITRPDYKFDWNDLLHFSPLVLELGVLALEIKESIRTGAATYDTLTFKQLNPLLQLLAFISVMIYLYLSHRLIERFYRQLKFNQVRDRYRYGLRWLHHLLACFGLLWLLWIPYTAIAYFYYHNPLGLHGYYPLYLLLAVMMIRIAAAAFLRPEAGEQGREPLVSKPLPSRLLRQKATWLRKAMETGLFYRDTELSLGSLAEKLDMHPHELSRIINIALKKNFNDFINEYRIREVTRKMQDPAYDRLTLLGIAFDSGFNSKATFNRTFRQMTGKSPKEYKNELKKERSTYHLRPFFHSAAVISCHEATPRWSSEKLNRNYMFRNYLKIAWRNFAKNKVSSFINTGGLALGIAVALLIGLYIYDEFSFNKSFRNYDRIAMVMSRWKLSDRANPSQSMALGNALKNSYERDFDRVVISSGAEGHVIAYGDKKFIQQGKFMQPEGAELFSFHMIDGNRAGLNSPNSIMLGASLAKKLFGNTDPVGKVLKMDNQLNLAVTGVYEDFPENTDFKGLAFISQLDAYMGLNGQLPGKQGDWNTLWATTYVQLSPRADLEQVSAKIAGIKSGHVSQDEMAAGPSVFLHPMSKWHLYSAFGMGGIAIKSVPVRTIWLYSIIGIFVLLLACINFMNLSTARSEKRAKEVGIRKAIGSMRSQLISQFFSESLLTAAFAFVMAILIVLLVLPWFNSLSGKDLGLLWTNPVFWLASVVFTVFTGLIAGAYPALYLSSFNPVKVLKGPFRTGRFAALPRKALVVLQFAVSITLIIGTAVVYRQVAFAKDRPVGYDRQGLIEVPVNDPDFKAFDALENELKRTGAAVQVTESASPLTAIGSSNSGLKWPGKDEAFKDQFGTLAVTPSYGKTVGWKFLDGRDFSADRNDSAGFVVNEAAVKYMGLKDPVGRVMQWPRFMAKNFRIIGVVKDMVMNSPFDPAYPTIFFLSPDDPRAWVLVKLNPNLSAAASLPKVAGVFGKLMPAVPFDYQFADDDYAAKFAAEERMGKFAIFFAVLAVLISCLGLFGLTAFVAEQRTKELGIRKVLGASVFNLWGMLSREFLLLVGVSFLTAVPFAFYLMQAWLQKYQYRSTLSWWIFAGAGVGAMIIALITVSFQSIRAAVTNPITSLRSE